MSVSELHLKPQPQVFISYASADRAIAESLMAELRSHTLDVSLEMGELRPGHDWVESIRAAISASAYFLLLLSHHSVHADWMDENVEAVLKELQSRDITFLPVLLEDCPIPPALAGYQFFDMRGGVASSLDTLAEALQLTPKIDFEALSPQSFEELVADVLQTLGFVNWQSKIPQNNSSVDAVVEFHQKDALGAEIREIYAVETKLYSHSRANLQALRQLAGYAKNTPNVHKALLVTDGNLTSVALDWVNNTPEVTGIPIRVIDGTELKRLLLQNAELVSKYFPANFSHAS